MTRTRARTTLATGPVAVGLALLLSVGVLQPELIDPGPGLGTYQWAIALQSAGTLTALGIAAARTRGRVRLSWAAIALVAFTWTLAMSAALANWNDDLVWLWLRGTVAIAGVAGLLVIPAVCRTPREWGLVMLDGWLVGGSVFVIGWVALEHTGSLLTNAADRPMLPWIAVDLVFASLTAGQAMRANPSMRTPVVLMVLVSLLALTGDTTWALTGLPYFPTVQWMIMMYALAGASTSPRLDLWQGPTTTPAPPGLLRWSQLAVVPGLVAAVISPHNRVVVAVSLSVMLGMACEIVLVSLQNQELWTTLHAQAHRLDQVLRDSRDAILQVDECGAVEFLNEAAAEVLGWPPAALLGHRLVDVIHPEDLMSAIDQIQRLGPDCLSVRVTGRFRQPDGTFRCLEATVSGRTGQTSGLTVLARDVSEQVLLQTQLHKLASTDPLTNLANRHRFLTLLTERLAGGQAAVLFLDLDGFKQVNDVLGHAAGDRLLCNLADALQSELEPDDVAARLGGDEFAILPGSPDQADVDALALRIATRIANLPSDADRRAGASIGVAVGRGGPAEALLADADLAMYEAKMAGGGRPVRFDPAMRRRATEQARIKASLKRACSGDGLRLDVQPIVEMARGSWVGFEALLRWRDGPCVHRPSAFLPLAEESGLIVPIGAWALCSALTWLSEWPDPTVGISVNLAARQVAAVGFTEIVTSALDTTGVAPHRLTLEITEQTAMEDIERADTVLQPLRTFGVQVSLDDFGTGFSRLGYLAQLPVDELKIDGQFVAGLGIRPENDALVRAVTGLAADLGLRVVAEGVETSQQARRLLDHGCTLGQGQHFLAPVPAATIRPPSVSRSPRIGHSPQPLHLGSPLTTP